MKRIKQLIMSLIFVLGVGAAFVPALPVGAVSVDPIKTACDSSGSSDAAVCKSSGDNVSTVVTTVVNVLLFVIGIISVIMIIIGGIQYSVSGGDAGAITKAKNTILYAIIGLAVAFFAFAIVNWVVLRFVHP